MTLSTNLNYLLTRTTDHWFVKTPTYAMEDFLEELLQVKKVGPRGSESYMSLKEVLGKDITSIHYQTTKEVYIFLILIPTPPPFNSFKIRRVGHFKFKLLGYPYPSFPYKRLRQKEILHRQICYSVSQGKL